MSVSVLRVLPGRCELGSGQVSLFLYLCSDSVRFTYSLFLCQRYVNHISKIMVCYL